MTRSYIGASLKRKEDRRLAVGRGRFVDDVVLPGLLHCALVRSPHAHARLVTADTGAARAMAGVVDVVTGAEIQGQAPVICAWPLPGMHLPEQQALAVDRVRYCGEPVAAVVATDPQTARDAAQRVRVIYEALPAVTDMEAALAPSAPLVHERFGTNRCFLWSLPGQGVDEAFARAPVVFRQRFVNHRIHASPLEPRGALAAWDQADGTLRLWSSTQIPHILRLVLALSTGIPEHRIRVIAPEVGGGFGSKLNYYREEGICVLLSRRTGRPVKWIEDRTENFRGATHARDHIQDVEVAATREGRVEALRLRILADMGAYLQLLTPGIPVLTALMASGPYAIPAIQVEVTGVFTNKTPTDAYRGAGKPEATYVLERTMDLLAAELGLDPAAVRRVNFIPASKFPFTTATGVVYDSGSYDAVLGRALELVQYEQVRAEQARQRQRGRYLGIGLSTYVEVSGFGPSSVCGAVGLQAGGYESGTVRVHPSGKIKVITGSSPHGQGHETTWAQIVADVFGVAPDDVDVIHGDTEAAPYGLGTYGSRSAPVGGTAVLLAAQKVLDKARHLAAHLLEAAPADVIFEAGRFQVRGTPDRFRAFADVALAAYLAHSLPPGTEPGLEATAFFDPPNFTFPFGAHVAVVEVDPESGLVELRKYVAVDDFGRVINPMIVEGQVHGGVTQGIGQALWEEIRYGQDGQLLTGSYLDYAVPSAAMVPPYLTDRVETPSPSNPLGVKGCGESGITGAPPAVVNAVVDALAPFGVRHLDMPLRPERVWRAMRGARPCA